MSALRVKRLEGGVGRTPNTFHSRAAVTTAFALSLSKPGAPGKAQGLSVVGQMAQEIFLPGAAAIIARLPARSAAWVGAPWSREAESRRSGLDHQIPRPRRPLELISELRAKRESRRKPNRRAPRKSHPVSSRSFSNDDESRYNRILHPRLCPRCPVPKSKGRANPLRESPVPPRRGVRGPRSNGGPGKWW